MKIYAKVESGIVTEFPVALPKSIKQDNGQWLCNFDNADKATSANLGYYELIEVKPTFNDAFEYLGDPVLTVGIDDVTATYPVITKSLDDYKKEAMTSVYAKAKQLMDEQSEGYSQAEIATWPQIQQDVMAYNADNAVIGVALQNAVNHSAYTAAELSTILTPRIASQNHIMDRRAQLVSLIRSATDHLSISALDIDSGWQVA